MNLNAGERTIVFRNFVYLPDKSFPVCAIFSNSGTTGLPTAAGSGSPTSRRCSRRSNGRSTLLREPVALTGAGRTDTGVNAAYYVAHFDCERPVADPAQTVYKLNFLLPGDIAVGSMTPVAEDAHARFHAREREYRYFIEPRKNPFTRHETWQYYVPLDVGRMNEAAAMLTAYDDFTSFAKLNSNNKTNICRVKEAVWTIDSRGTMCFTIRADRFLRNMVRSLVGTLVDVGRGRYTPDGFRSIVESRDLSRSSAGAPAQGLFLSDVVYPADIFEHQCFSKFKML